MYCWDGGVLLYGGCIHIAEDMFPDIQYSVIVRVCAAYMGVVLNSTCWHTCKGWMNPIPCTATVLVLKNKVRNEDAWRLIGDEM